MNSLKNRIKVPPKCQKVENKKKMDQLAPKEQLEAYKEVINKLLKNPNMTKKAAQIITEMLEKKKSP